MDWGYIANEVFNKFVIFGLVVVSYHGGKFNVQYDREKEKTKASIGTIIRLILTDILACLIIGGVASQGTRSPQFYINFLFLVIPSLAGLWRGIELDNKRIEEANRID